MIGYKNYIDKVCVDAAKSEEKPCDLEWQSCEVGNTVLFALKSRYLRVKSRVFFRLVNNFRRNFGKNICIMDVTKSDGQFCRQNDLTVLYDLFPLGSGFDPNYSFAKWIVFGKAYTIRAFGDDSLRCPAVFENDSDGCSMHIKNLIEKFGFDEYMQISWEDYLAFCQRKYDWTPTQPQHFCGNDLAKNNLI